MAKKTAKAKMDEKAKSIKIEEKLLKEKLENAEKLAKEFHSVKHQLEELEEKKDKLRLELIELFESDIDLTCFQISISRTEKLNYKESKKAWMKANKGQKPPTKIIPQHEEEDKASFTAILKDFENKIVKKGFMVKTNSKK